MTNKLKFFIVNWKMFGDFSSFKIINKINQFNIKAKKKIVLCVPNTLIYFFNKKLKTKYISLGAQNCHHQKDYGPFTGSINASMLKKCGAKFIILGHSENRKEGESDRLIKKKIASSLKENLNVVFCIGETSIQKNSGRTLHVLKKQLKNSLDKKFDPNKLVFAYEPVWSIGTNKIPEIDDLSKIVLSIKKELKKIFKNSKFPQVLYGGSVNPQNIRLFSKIDELDGFLIGGASQSSKKFIDIIKNYYK